LQNTNKQAIIAINEFTKPTWADIKYIMSETRISLDNPKSLSLLSDDDFQTLLLEGVSRTFALTIPQLPEKLYGAVANAYLLCRIVDTIEDEVSLSAAQKKYFCSEFIDVVKTGVNAEPFAVELAPLLSEQTIPAEHTLIHVLPRVIQITHGFDEDQIDALACCVETMAEGMPIFQAQNLHDGLALLIWTGIVTTSQVAWAKCWPSFFAITLLK
jgi:farnesyl-diphosphate farnesyltransferase